MFPSPWDRGRVEKEERFGKKVEEPRPLKKKGNHAKPISGLGRRSALGGPCHFDAGISGMASFLKGFRSGAATW